MSNDISRAPGDVKKINIAAFGGSLRRNSFNGYLLNVASRNVPEYVAFRIAPIKDLPMYNTDEEEKPVEAVVNFKNVLRDADGILIVTPEYNYSIPGFIKNAIDIASRPYSDNVLKGKHVAVMSASMSAFGGMRAQYHLRQVFVYLDMKPINKPEVFINFAQDKFDSSGELKDEKSLRLVQELMMNLATECMRDRLV